MSLSSQVNSLAGRVSSEFKAIKFTVSDAEIRAALGLAPPDTTPPTAPGAPTASEITSSSVRLTWAPSTDNTAVDRYEYSLSGGAWVPVGNVTTTVITGLLGGTTYTSPKVRARDAANNSSPESVGSSFTTVAVDTTAPTAPGVPTTSAITETSATLTWTAATDAVGVTGYEYSLDNAVTWVNVGNVLTKSITGLTAGTAYPAPRVRAYDAAGNKGAVATAASGFSTTAPPVGYTGPALLTDFIGDSITQTYNTDPASFGSSVPLALAMESGGRIRPRYNKGIGGQQSSAIAARFTADIVNATPKAEAVLIMCGSNDAAGAISVSSYMSNITSMVNAAKAAGITPIVVTPPPKRSDATTGDRDLLQGYTDALNAYTGAVVLDIHTPSKNASGYLDNQYLDDIVHPNAIGKAYLGQLGATALMAKTNITPISLATVPSPTGTLWASTVNSIFSTGTAAAPGGWEVWNGGNPPTGVSLSMTTKTVGRAWRWTFDNYPNWNVLAKVGFDTSKVAAGDKVRISFVLSKSAGSSPAFTLYKNGIFGTEIGKPMMDQAGGDFKGALTDAVVVYEFTVPTATTNIEMSMMTNKADPGSWFELSQMTAVKI